MSKHDKETEETPEQPSRRTTVEAGEDDRSFQSLDKAKFGRLLKSLRRARGLTQEQLAERIGSTGNYVFMYETNRSGIGWEMLNRIGLALGIPSSWILFIASPDEAPGVPNKLKKRIRDTKNSLLGLIHSEPLTMDDLDQTMSPGR